jgi:hypothetical protein
MANKTFTSTTLTASDVNTYLMKQAVIGCTSSTRPTPVEGMTIFETDTDRLMTYDGSAWRDVVALGATRTFAVPPALWSPLTQNAVGLGGTTFNGTWCRSGNLVMAHMRWTGVGTYAGPLGVEYAELPIPDEQPSLVGEWMIIRTSGARVGGVMRHVGAFGFAFEQSGLSAYFASFQSGDELFVNLHYLADP